MGRLIPKICNIYSFAPITEPAPTKAKFGVEQPTYGPLVFHANFHLDRVARVGRKNTNSTSE